MRNPDVNNNKNKQFVTHHNLTNKHLLEKLISSIQTTIPKPHHPLHEEAKLHFERPGKHLRGLTSLLLSQALELPVKPSLDWAVAVELMHNASLVHDDICDKDTMRRGQTSVWLKFGTDKALCLGDWLVAQSFKAAAKSFKDSKASAMAIASLAEAMATLCAGQAREFDRKPVLDWFTYDRIVTEKTTPLLKASVLGPLHMAGETTLIKPLSELFTKVGLAYQMANDLQNVMIDDGHEDSFSDLKRGAPNAVIVSYVAQVVMEQHNEFLDWYETRSDSQFSFWKHRIIESEAIHNTCARLNHMINDIDKTILSLPNHISESLTPMISYLQQIRVVAK